MLNLLAEKSGWSQPLKPIAGRRVGRGVSAQFAFGTYMAQVAEVSVCADGEVRMQRVVCALDCGQVVNPDTVVAQMEGGVVFGLTAALWRPGHIRQGPCAAVEFRRLPDDAHRGGARWWRVRIVTSSDEPGGIGEPGTAAIAPAVANAVFAATADPRRRRAGLHQAQTRWQSPPCRQYNLRACRRRSQQTNDDRNSCKFPKKFAMNALLSRT